MPTKTTTIETTPGELEKAAEDVAPEKLADPVERLTRRLRYYDNAVRDGHKPTYAERSIKDLIEAILQLKHAPQAERAAGTPAALGASVLASLELLVKRVEALEASALQAPVDHTIVNALQLRVDKLRDLVMKVMMKEGAE